MTTLDEQITAWTKAEQAGDTDLLDTLLHPQFLAVAPTAPSSTAPMESPILRPTALRALGVGRRTGQRHWEP